MPLFSYFAPKSTIGRDTAHGICFFFTSFHSQLFHKTTHVSNVSREYRCPCGCGKLVRWQVLAPLLLLEEVRCSCCCDGARLIRWLYCFFGCTVQVEADQDDWTKLTGLRAARLEIFHMYKAAVFALGIVICRGYQSKTSGRLEAAKLGLFSGIGCKPPRLRSDFLSRRPS